RPIPKSRKWRLLGGGGGGANSFLNTRRCRSSVPLTPALSPREREALGSATAYFRSRRQYGRHPLRPRRRRFSLSHREGRGEEGPSARITTLCRPLPAPLPRARRGRGSPLGRVRGAGPPILRLCCIDPHARSGNRSTYRDAL